MGHGSLIDEGSAGCGVLPKSTQGVLPTSAQGVLLRSVQMDGCVQSMSNSMPELEVFDSKLRAGGDSPSAGLGLSLSATFFLKLLNGPHILSYIPAIWLARIFQFFALFHIPTASDCWNVRSAIDQALRKLEGRVLSEGFGILLISERICVRMTAIECH